MTLFTIVLGSQALKLAQMIASAIPRVRTVGICLSINESRVMGEIPRIMKIKSPEL